VPRTVTDFVLDRLAELDVTRIYGHPGDGINGLTSALRRAGDRWTRAAAVLEAEGIATRLVSMSCREGVMRAMWSA
jgi:thiamine pyrophosphate-dependent acetolactate synthase large subunit-like protein